MTTSKNVLAYAKRKDRNHKDAVIMIRSVGYTVVELSGAGEGVPDILVVSKVDRRVTSFFEIKVDNEPLRDKEKTFFLNYPGLAYVVRSEEHAGDEAGREIVSIMEHLEKEL